MASMYPQGERAIVFNKTSTLGLLLGAVLFGVWLLQTPAGLLGKADAIGYAVCHRIDLRSFHLTERALPLCARCTGTYLGVALAFVFFGIRRGRAALFPPKKVLLPLAIMALLWVFDGINSAVDLLPAVESLYPPSNTLRLATGMFFGIALASFVYPGFHQSSWKDALVEPALRSFKDLALLLLLGILLILAVETENPILLYPLALISSGTIMILLTMMYSILIMGWLKKENLALRWDHLVPVLFSGFILAIVQIGLFNLVRYSIFQTWGGFSFS
jgi:uncharacterized membrane protein